MNYTNYIRTIRGNLCQTLTQSRDNEKRMQRVRESIENIEMAQTTEFPLITGMIDRELNAEVEFCEMLNDIYNTEINRLALLVLKINKEI